MTIKRRNPNYRASVSVDKGVSRAASTSVNGAVVTLVGVATAVQSGVPIATALTGGGIGAIATLATAAIQGWRRWRRNKRKHEFEEVMHPLDV